jgi:hypothetical protein
MMIFVDVSIAFSAWPSCRSLYGSQRCVLADCTQFEIATRLALAGKAQITGPSSVARSAVLGFIPHWCGDLTGARQAAHYVEPIGARSAESARCPPESLRGTVCFYAVLLMSITNPASGSSPASRAARTR